MKGVICVNKPFGCTSFDVVAKLRKILKIKRIGHSGTLDPIATGVLPVFIGKATKAISFLPSTDKAYVAGFRLGQTTDTLDCSGKLIEERKSEVDLQSLKLSLGKFRGLILQEPPQFSAIKIKGTPAYRLARRGQEVKMEPRLVNIFKIECINFDFETQSGNFFVNCSSGTYVRAICRDLGASLGVGCVLTSLVRTMACGWKLENCFSIEEIETLSLEGNFSKFLFSVDSLFKNLERVNLSCQERIKFLNGAKFQKKLNRFHENRMLSVYFENEFLGLAKFERGFIVVEKLFV